MTATDLGAFQPGSAVPAWLSDLGRAAARLEVPPALRAAGADTARPAAVLILFGTGPAGPDLLLVQRAARLRRHPGQPAFPGGAIDEADGSPAAAALREAAEEARVDPRGVAVVGQLPELYLARSGFLVTPVLAWWLRPAPVAPGDLGEIAAVRRVPVAELAEPANRLIIRYPSGQAGPAFRAGGLLVWGFTAAILDMMLALGGWERPWDRDHVTALPSGALVGNDGPWPGAGG